MAGAALFDLDGRVALVTGAGQGVGRGLALALAAHGAGGIAVNDVHAGRAGAVAAEIRGTGVPAAAAVFDVGDLVAVRAGIAAAEAALGPLAILVNNAGNGGPTGFPADFPLFWESDPARWRRFLDVNLLGVMNCCHAALPGMAARGYGRVVTIISDAARTLATRQADYAAAKAGAAGFMRALAGDAGRFGVTANCLSIATIRPDLPPEQLDTFLASARSRAQLDRYAIRRYGLPEDVAGAAVLLCSDAGAWITGQVYAVNGGYAPAL